MVLATVASGCLSTKRLQGNEKLLYRQTIKAPKGFGQEGLKDLLVQKTNARLGITVSMYYLGKRKYNREKFVEKKVKLEAKFDKKIAATKKAKRIANLQYRKQNKVDAINKKIINGNLFMQWGEPLTVFDTAGMQLSKDRIQILLFNNGYFKATVRAIFHEIRKKRIAVEYQISPGPSFVYDTIFYNIPDRKVLNLIVKNNSHSLLKKGEDYNQGKLGKERDRIDLLLKDNGFFDFSKQFVDFSIDTAAKKHKVKLQIEILNPARRGYHKQFTVDSIIFTTDVAALNKGDTKRKNSFFHHITFSSYEQLYSKKILAQRVFIVKDSLYSRTKTFSTQRQLANLDNFKFVNLNYDTTGGRFVANLFTSPLDRYTWGNETGMTVTQGFPGPYISSNFKKRNVFGGLEILEINGRFGFEGVAVLLLTVDFIKVLRQAETPLLLFHNFYFPSAARQRFDTLKIIHAQKYWRATPTPIAPSTSDRSLRFLPLTLGTCKGDCNFHLAQPH